MPHRIPTQDLLDELKRVTDILGHVPSYEDMRAHGAISPTTFQRRFGAWDLVKKQAGWIPPWESFDASAVPPADGSWLSGLIDGEGCFRIAKPSPKSGNGLSKSYAPVFTMSVRDDDSFLIDEVKRILHIPNAAVHLDNRAACIRKGMKANPAVKINLRDVPTLAYHLIPTLKLYPLRSKKKQEIPVFEFAVDTLLQKRLEGRRNCRYNDREREILHKCYLALMRLKEYQANLYDVLKEFDLSL